MCCIIGLYRDVSGLVRLRVTTHIPMVPGPPAPAPHHPATPRGDEYITPSPPISSQARPHQSVPLSARLTYHHHHPDAKKMARKVIWFLVKTMNV